MSTAEFPKKVRYVYNCMLIRPPWWQRVFMRFLPEHVFDGALHTIRYKYWGWWLWIITADQKTVQQEKKGIDILGKCGYYFPWVN